MLVTLSGMGITEKAEGDCRGAIREDRGPPAQPCRPANANVESMAKTARRDCIGRISGVTVVGAMEINNRKDVIIPLQKK
jgi:hypothetical protein